MRGHPRFLLWHAEPDPDEIGTGLIDCGNIGRVFLRSQGPKRRRAVASNDQPWIALGQARHQLLDDGRAGAVEIMPIAARDSQGAHRVEEIGSAHAARLRETGVATPPDKRHPVLSGEPGAVESVVNFPIALCRDEAMNRDAAHVIAPTSVAPFVKNGDSLGQVKRCDADAEHIDPTCGVWRRHPRASVFYRGQCEACFFTIVEELCVSDTTLACSWPRRCAYPRTSNFSRKRRRAPAPNRWRSSSSSITRTSAAASA